MSNAFDFDEDEVDYYYEKHQEKVLEEKPIILTHELIASIVYMELYKKESVERFEKFMRGIEDDGKFIKRRLADNYALANSLAYKYLNDPQMQELLEKTYNEARKAYELSFKKDEKDK